MRCLLVLLLVLAPMRALADDVATETGTIEGVAVDGVFEPLPGATVRIVGDATVTTVRANAWGAIEVRGLPAGTYRIEVEGGAFSQRSIAPPPPLRITEDRRSLRFDRTYIRCCICVMEDNRRRVEADLAKRNQELEDAANAMIDTHSTTLGARLVRGRDF